MIEARELLLQMKIASFPYMKERDRDEWHGNLATIAYPRKLEPIESAGCLEGQEALAAVLGVIRG